MRVVTPSFKVFQYSSMHVLKNLSYIFKAIGYSLSRFTFCRQSYNTYTKGGGGTTLEASSAVTSPLIFLANPKTLQLV